MALDKTADGGLLKVQTVSVATSKKASSEFTDPPKNGAFVGVLMQFNCVTGPCDYNPFDFVMRGADGAEYDQAFTFNDPTFQPDLKSGTLTSGVPARGYVVYDVAPGTYSLEYRANIFDGEAASWKIRSPDDRRRELVMRAPSPTQGAHEDRCPPIAYLGDQVDQGGAARQPGHAREDLMGIVLAVVFCWIVLAIVARAVRHVRKERYFAGPDFLAHKERSRAVVADHNDVSRYASEIRANGSFEIGASETGAYAHLATFESTGHRNYQRDRHVANYGDPNEHNCSLQVVRNASADPLKYLMKYFGIRPDEATLADVENVSETIARLQDAVDNLRQREASITRSISPPAFILQHYKDEFIKRVGVELPPIRIPYPVYTFKYVSPGGNSAEQTVVTLDTPTLDALIETLGEKIRFRRSAAGQRALMTTRLRELIKERDGHTCQNPACRMSLALQSHLLLEVDHIIPVSRGGLSVPATSRPSAGAATGPSRTSSRPSSARVGGSPGRPTLDARPTASERRQRPHATTRPAAPRADPPRAARPPERTRSLTPPRRPRPRSSHADSPLRTGARIPPNWSSGVPGRAGWHRGQVLRPGERAGPRGQDRDHAPAHR